MFIMNRLIDQKTKEIDSLALIEAADLRAKQQWGGAVPPPAFIRSAVTFVHDRARDLRLEWRRRHGLPNDSPVTLTEVPAWGASGDSYGGTS